MSLESKLRTAAASYTPLTTLIGSAPLRWWDTQLVQGSALPAIVVQLIAGTPTYVFGGRLRTGWNLVQFTIWANSGEQARACESALLGFLDQCNLIGIAGLSQYPNRVTLQRSGLLPDTEPPKYWRTVDAQIFDNTGVS